MKKINELVTKTEKPEQKAKRKAITFGSFKRAEERQIAERKEREHQKELALIAEQARIQREIKEEEERVIREENKRKRGEFITESISNAFNTKTDIDFKPVRERVIDKYLPQLKEQETLDDYPKPFEAEPALNRELAEFKKKINEHLHKVGFMGSGGGGIGDIGDAGDVDAATAKVNGKFLKFDSSTQKFVGADASSSGATAADDISAGDAAVNITTTSGNITIDAAANNSDIIFKGTDGGSDTTFLTIDGSEAGAATFNDKIIATELDISGNVDVDGTLEADAITVDGTTLTETIQDTVGAMFSSNTETGITASYQDADGTIDLVVGTLNQDTTGNAATATALETARTIGGTSFDGTANIAVALSAAATALETARTIHGVSFDGTANIDLTEVIQDTVGAMFSSNTETGIAVTYEDGDGTIDLVVGTLNQDTTGNAATATALETARTIGGVSFNGTANINLPGVNTSGTQDTSGNAATATALATARTIHGVSFDGTGNIDLSEVIQDTVGAMFSSNTETGITVSYEDGDGTIDLVVGTLNQDTTGNAATATALETARNIGGVSFDGTGNINLPGVNTAGNQDTSGTAAVATTVTITDNESTNEDNAIVFTAGGDVDGGNLGLESDGTLTYNPSTGKITATGFIGDVTGNVSGTAATVTGAAQSNITSLGTLTTLTVDNIIINGTNIGHTSDTDAIDIAADGKTTFSQNIIASGDIELGHASDTTLARSSAGVVTIEGNTIATREQLRGDATNGSGVLSDEIIKRKIHIGPTISKALSGDATVGLVAGRLLGGFVSQQVISQNQVLWMPIFIPGEGAGDTTNIASFQFRTGHSGTINSATVKMGLYSLNKFGFPSQLISKSSASSGTTTSTTINATPDVTEIMPGRYAMALGVAGSDTTLRSNFNSTSAGASFYMEGFSDQINAPGTKTFGFVRNSTLSSDELPTDLSSTTDYNDTASLPIMAVVLGENYAGE